MLAKLRVRALRNTVGAVAALVVLVAPATPSRGGTKSAVSCGATITASVRFTSDLVGCPSAGLIVGAAGITVDLNGHTLGGTNAPKSEGIADNGHANVKIVNGTIANFRLYGVSVRRAAGSSLSKLVVRQIGAGGKQGELSAGILIDHSPRSIIVDSVVTNHVRAYQADGVDVLSSSGTVVKRNRLARNAWNGLFVIQSPKSRVVGNVLSGNGNNGMEANVGSDSIRVERNRAGSNRRSGIVVGALRNARVLGNTASGNGQEGLLLFDLSSSVIRSNGASANQSGIHLFGGQHGSKLNQLLRNRTTKNKQAGIWVNGDAPRSASNNNLVSGNIASRNGRTGGIVVDGSAARNKLRGNAANANAGHGIAAGGGTIDGGGNRARGNRVAPQCVGVVCS